MKHLLIAAGEKILLWALAAAALFFFAASLSGCAIPAKILEATDAGITKIDEGVSEANRQFNQAGNNKIGRTRDTLDGVSDLHDDVVETSQSQADRQLNSAHAIQARVGERAARQIRFQCRDLPPGAEVTLTGTNIRTRCPEPPPPPQDE